MYTYMYINILPIKCRLYSLPLFPECPVGRYGISCRHECHCRNATERCDQLTGACKSGCHGSFTGDSCQGKEFTFCIKYNLSTVSCLNLFKIRQKSAGNCLTLE